MRILLVPIGSGGDVHPYIALALALKAQAHQPLLLLNPHFIPRAQAAGLDCLPLGTEEDYLRIVKSAELIHQTRGGGFVMRELVQLRSREMFTVCRRIIRQHKIDLVVRHLIAFAAGWAAERESVPTATGVLAPLFWLSRHEPLALAINRFRFDQPPLWLSSLARAIGTLAFRFAFDGPLNRLRAEFKLPTIRNIFPHEIRGGDLNLGLWSPAFRPALPDDPPNARICGFTWFDRQNADAGLSPQLEQFVAQGEPPIVFTLGTSVVHHAGPFYALAADAARRLGRRAVLLTGTDLPPPAALPPGVQAFPYAPFSALLPRAAATVHHGGIGTTAQGLRSGRPTVIIPFANDEFDNAARAKRLGASATLHLSRLNARNLAAALEAVLENPATLNRAASLGQALQAENGAAEAARAITERFAASTL